jgi:hypothetical protein
MHFRQWKRRAFITLLGGGRVRNARVVTSARYRA